MRFITIVFWITLFQMAAAEPSAAQAPVSTRQIVASQALFARSQLQAMAALLSVDPDGSISREFFQSGNAMVMLGQYSPAMGWPARGPTPKEALRPLLASIEAGRLNCAELSGECQKQALKTGTGQAKQILGATHPGKALASALGMK